jgi:hypothetical protein
MRCELEPRDDTLEARKLVYDGDQEFLQGHLVKSRELYEQGWEKWALVFKDFPAMLDESNTVDEMIDSIRHYRSVLQQLDEKFPKPFVLQNVLDADAKFHGGQLATTAGAPPADSADAKKAAAETPQEQTPPQQPTTTSPSDEPTKP